ncbi:hypothetical protein NBEOAGPD_0628 [Methylobacterium gregans]|uniref:DUF937 domain-containing protein n=2 Tax=Methylobacterium gregans TaxID=374424 RepID=A0AA37HKS5_9HYPH|nr:YidB family protein [Methylobacterium gregans]MDQ0523946.1 uncharacterized protein YidB (DUF937 family) [Methylobacterium gregans]GJD77423.1 hypothetical protein NBEOAGPD_0628 [Methylobacterium gregans]
MGLLDTVIGGVLGQVLGGGRGGPSGGPQGGGMGSAMSPIVKALLMLLLAKGASGGFGDIFGRGHQGEPGPEADRSGGAGPYGRDEGAGGSGGWDQEGGRRDAPLPPGDFSDLSGMLDGPGQGAEGLGRDPGAGPYAHLDREPGDRPDLGGLDGLIDGFRRGGLGDVIESWIGHGQNRPVQPNQLAEALGPDTVGTLERATGMSRDTLLTQLAQVLPEVINGLTPQGRVPGEGERRGW